jgi:quercetin dioxygenase-like cupin family protein
MSSGFYRPTETGRTFQFGPIPVTVLAEAADTEDAFALVQAVFPAGLPGPPRHRHPWQESFFVLAGELEFTVGDDVLRATAGDYVHAGADVLHAYANRGSQPASALGLFAPARFLAALEEIAAAVTSAGSPEAVAAVYAKWGAELMP